MDRIIQKRIEVALEKGVPKTEVREFAETDANFESLFSFNLSAHGHSIIAQLKTERIAPTPGPRGFAQNAKLIAEAPAMLNALRSLAGIEAWITDKKMKEHFQKVVYSITEKFN